MISNKTTVIRAFQSDCSIRESRSDCSIRVYEFQRGFLWKPWNPPGSATALQCIIQWVVQEASLQSIQSICGSTFVAPGLVQFRVISSSSSEVTVMWSPPLQPNGVITSYEVMYQTYQRSNTMEQITLEESDRSFVIQNLSMSSILLWTLWLFWFQNQVLLIKWR